MAAKLNCWQFWNCGREPGGLMTDSLGECPVGLAIEHDGENGGSAGGRVCWTITGCPAKGACDGTSCASCPFHKRVKYEKQGDKVKARKIPKVAEAV